MKKQNMIRYTVALSALASTLVSSATAATIQAATSAPALAIIIPGTSFDVKTKTMIGWLFAVSVGWLGVRAISASMSAMDERSKEERDDKIKGAWIAFGSGLAVFGVLSMMGLVSISDVETAINSF